MSKEYVNPNKVLPRKECNKEEGSCCVLFVACSKGCLECAKYFIQNGSDVNEREPFYGMTCLHAAAYENYFDIVKLLLENGADPTISCNLEGNPKAIDISSNPQIKEIIVNYILKKYSNHCAIYS